MTEDIPAEVDRYLEGLFGDPDDVVRQALARSRDASAAPSAGSARAKWH